MNDPAVYTAAEVAALCRVSEWTVASWTRTGVLPRLPRLPPPRPLQSHSRLAKRGGQRIPLWSAYWLVPQEGRLRNHGDWMSKQYGTAPDPGAGPEFDADTMTHAWAILEAFVVAKDGEALPNPNRWEPDRYNAAAFVTALLAEYTRLRQKAQDAAERIGRA